MNNTILLVEDEPKTGEMLKRALEAKIEGISIVWTTDGDSALQEVEKGKFELIILDLKLPGINGEELLEKIRNTDPYVEVIVYTNYEESPVMLKLLNLEVQGYIKKGGDADLWDMVEKVKSRLTPLSEEDRAKLLESAPKEIFREYSSKVNI